MGINWEICTQRRLVMGNRYHEVDIYRDQCAEMRYGGRDGV